MRRATKDERIHKRIATLEKTQNSCCIFSKDMLSMIHEDRKHIRDLTTEFNTHEARLSSNQMMIDRHDRQIYELLKVDVSHTSRICSLRFETRSLKREIENLKILLWILTLLAVLILAVIAF